MKWVNLRMLASGPAPENHHSVRRVHVPKIASCLYINKWKQENFCFVYSLDMTLESVQLIIQNVTRKDHSHPGSQLQNSHVTTLGLSGYQCGWWWSPHWPEWREWIRHSWGALIFYHSVFTCTFIKNSNPSGKSSIWFFYVSCRALLYMTLVN